jgi:hypothetical protein
MHATKEKNLPEDGTEKVGGGCILLY